MKGFLAITALLITVGVSAQQTFELTTSNPEQKIWLYNSKGVVLADKDSIVGKDFFNADGVFIQSNMPYKKEDRYFIIVNNSKAENKLMMMEMPVVSGEIKREILESELELLLIFGKKINEQYISFKVIVR